MSRFRRRTERQMPELNLASLPDLIFTVLFFFMIVTHMRQSDVLVRYVVPQGNEIEKLEHRSGMVYLYIGQPVDPQGSATSAETRIQLNNRYVALSDLSRQLAAEREQMSPADRQHFSVSIHADRNVDMGLVADVKQALRRAGVQRVNYIGSQVSGERKEVSGERR